MFIKYTVLFVPIATHRRTQLNNS